MSEDHPDPGLSGAIVRELVDLAVLIDAADGSLEACDVETAMAEIVTLALAIDRIDAAIAARLGVVDAEKSRQLSGPVPDRRGAPTGSPGQPHPTPAP